MHAEGLSVAYGSATLLSQVSLNVPPGKRVALLGPNGAGKSTLLRCLAGVLAAGSGELLLNNKHIGELAPDERVSQIAYLPQQFDTPFAFHVRELLALGGPWSEMHPALDALELRSLLDRPLTRLSGGERQRASLGRVLLSKAPYVLLDEPLAHLDPRHALRLLRHLSERASSGDSVVVALHDLALARRWADHVWLLREGTLRFDGPMAELPSQALEDIFDLDESDLLNFS